ncbi:MAG: CHAT domain-containing protein, partial [Phaeodactylibacter sp.]|nr:CHAT domain-containing protein [Phaeodactylibacter sp.]
AKDPTDDSTLLRLKDELFDAEQEYYNFQQKLKERNPNYFDIRYNESFVSVEEVQQELLEPSQALVEYFLADSVLYIMAITPQDYSLAAVQRDFSLNGWIAQLRQGLATPASVFEETDEDRISKKRAYTEAAFALYEKLVQPVFPVIAGQEEWIIVPDSITSVIPFDVLLSEKPDMAQSFRSYPYLLKQYAISYAFSASFLKSVKRRPGGCPNCKNLLVLAPGYGVSPTPSEFGPLTHNIHRNSALAKAFGGTLDTFPTKANFFAAAPNYHVIHCSMHAKANPQQGVQSFLAFPSQSAEQPFIPLYVRELYSMNLRAELVVLSACETGFGELKQTDGIISLGQGIAYAGAKSLITSLWKLEGSSTYDVMDQFYAELKNSGNSKSKALQLAKLHYLQHSNRPEPAYWAGLIAIGDMEPIDWKKGRQYPRLIWVLAGLAVLSLAFFLWKRKG